MGRLRAELWRGKTERRGIVIGMEQSATQGLKEKKQLERQHEEKHHQHRVSLL